MFNNIYRNKKVLLFGNTGFVGTNLTLLLHKLGAIVVGYSNKDFDYFLDINKKINSEYWLQKIEDYEMVLSVIEEEKPDTIINLAAQALVKTSYQYPKETYETNILGTLNILEALRVINKSIVFLNITTDKVYKDKYKNIGYIEEDELNGYDPYSNSKSCVELITETYRNSFFNLNDYGKTHNILIATLRSGNILGSGDFGNYRLIPDIIRSIQKKEKLIIRYPNAIRPWIYIFDTLSGYLRVGEELLKRNKEFSGAWNFSSNDFDMISVLEILKRIKKYFDFDFEIQESKEKESTILKLDSSKARIFLNWKPKYDIEQTIEKTMGWYREYITNNKIITEQQLEEYMKGE